MQATVDLTPDQLARLVAAVFEANGMNAYGLALYKEGQLVGYDRVVVHYNLERDLEVYPRPRQNMTREQINDLLYPDGNIGTARLTPAGS